MRYIIVLLSVLGFISCATDEVVNFEISENDLAGLSPLDRAELSVDFMEDFILSPRKENEEKFGSLSTEYLAKFRDARSREDLYPSVKAAMIENPDQPTAIQAIALTYLRRQFIPSTSTESYSETQFLLDLLIENDAIDLDVLADAYKKLEGQLTESDKTRYLEYLNALHSSDTDGLVEKFLELKDAYENAGNARERNRLLFEGKLLERRSKSAKYAKELLGLGGS